MWKTYGQGVAVFSRLDLLRSALEPILDEVFLGIVHYGEKDMAGYNLVQFLFTKRRHFEKERELRVLLTSYDPVAGVNRHFDENNFPHREPLNETNPLHPWVHTCKRRRINLKALLTGIRVSPWATASDIDGVRTWVKNKNFECQIAASELTSPLTPSLEELRRVSA